MLNSESKDVLEVWHGTRKGEMQKQDDPASFIVLETKKEEIRTKAKDSRDPKNIQLEEKKERK